MGMLDEYDYLDIGAQRLYGKTFSELEEQASEMGVEITEEYRKALYRCGRREIELGLWEDDV